MKGKFKIITAMLIFGSIGLFVKKINLSSSEIALLRAVIGSLFLIGASFMVGQTVSVKAIKQNILLVLLSGAAIGINWILLFESYRFTSISNATLSYYFAPVFVMILSPFILKEKLSPVKACCVAAAMVGLFLVVNTGSSSGSSYNHLAGISYGVLAAVFYASAVLINKFIKNLSGFETTLVQLISAALTLLPYVFIRNPRAFSGISRNSIFFILIVGIIHTGIAYYLYFTSLKELKAQTIAMISYIDPIFAVIASAILLGESMSPIQIIGGVLILGSTFVSERLDFKAKHKQS